MDFNYKISSYKSILILTYLHLEQFIALLFYQHDIRIGWDAWR